MQFCPSASLPVWIKTEIVNRIESFDNSTTSVTIHMCDGGAYCQEDEGTNKL